MFIFSASHDWQNDIAVKQVLVFATPFAKESFDEEFANRVEQYGIEDAYDNGIGAIYKLRAVKDSNGLWIPIIRCGFTGASLWEEPSARCKRPEAAIEACKVQLLKLISESF